MLRIVWYVFHLQMSPIAICIIYQNDFMQPTFWFCPPRNEILYCWTFFIFFCTFSFCFCWFCLSVRQCMLPFIMNFSCITYRWWSVERDKNFLLCPLYISIDNWQEQQFWSNQTDILWYQLSQKENYGGSQI